MAKPVYLLVIGKGFTEAWHQLSEEEQNNMWSKVGEADERAGMKYIAGCESRWSNEEAESFFLFEYPNMDAYRKKVEEVQKLNWWRYIKTKTILGTRHPTWVS